MPGPYRGLSIVMSAAPADDGVRWLKLTAEIATVDPGSADSLVAPSVILVAQGLRVGGPLGAAAAGLVAYGAHRLRRAMAAPEPERPGQHRAA